MSALPPRHRSAALYRAAEPGAGHALHGAGVPGAAADIAWRTADDLGDPADIDAAVCWLPPAGLLGALPNLRLIQSIGAGVDHIYADPAVPRHVPVCRVAEAGMAAGMSSYVAWAVINHHRHFPDYVRNHARGVARESHRAAIGTPRGNRRAGPAGPGRARAGGAGLSRLRAGAARPSPIWPRASRAITAPTACRRCWPRPTRWSACCR